MVYWFAAERPKARGAELKLPEKVRQSRDDAAKKLTPEELMKVQERARKWF